MDVKLIITETSSTQEHIKDILMDKQNMGNSAFILYYKDYSHDRLYDIMHEDLYRFSPNDSSGENHINQWYVGRNYGKYCGVRVIVDDQDPSDPIVSESMKEIPYIPQRIKDFMQRIKDYIDTHSVDNYIDLDDIIL